MNIASVSVSRPAHTRKQAARIDVIVDVVDVRKKTGCESYVAVVVVAVVARMVVLLMIMMAVRMVYGRHIHVYSDDEH